MNTNDIEAHRHPTDTQQKLNEVLDYLQNETMKLEAAYGNNFRKEATEKARAATEKLREAVYAVNKSYRKRRGEPVAWAMFADNGNIRIWARKPMSHPDCVPLYTAPQPDDFYAQLNRKANSTE